MRTNAATILRWGLAFVFFYAAVQTLRDPQGWIGYLPQFIAASSRATLILACFAVYELLLAVWLFWGKKLVWSSLFALATLALIALVNIQVLDLVFRDIGLAMAALALFELARGKGNGAEEEG